MPLHPCDGELLSQPIDTISAFGKLRLSGLRPGFAMKTTQRPNRRTRRDALLKLKDKPFETICQCARRSTTSESLSSTIGSTWRFKVNNAIHWPRLRHNWRATARLDQQAFAAGARERDILNRRIRRCASARPKRRAGA
jgi:hypothetical protein